MAAEPRATAARQLLNLIERPASARAQQQARASVRVPGGKGPIDFLAVQARTALEGAQKFIATGAYKHPDIKAVNSILAGVVVVLACITVSNVVFAAVRYNRVYHPPVSAHPAAAVSTHPAPSGFLNQASYYLEKARGRDLFTMAVKKSAKMLGMGPSQRAVEATAHLRLVGISWSNDPDAMIEDTKAQRTLFLKSGQTIDGDIKVESISKDKVMISYGGEEIELR
jgi:hypothetical protein